MLRQFYNLSYRRAEQLLADGDGLRAAIGMKLTPDHNTLCDAFDTLVKIEHFAPMLDELARVFEELGLLKLDQKPLAADSTHFESHHVSRHFAERKKRSEAKPDKSLGKSSGKSPGNQKGKISGEKTKAAKSATRDQTVKRLPKLAIAVASAAHLILSMWSGTGMGGDRRHFETLAYHAWKRAGVKIIVADGGYDSADNHHLVRSDLNCELLIPPVIGRQSDEPLRDPWRALMKRVWTRPEVQKIYRQRWQVETVNSMMKRNYGSALRARSPERREREMLLKAMTHNIAI